MTPLLPDQQAVLSGETYEFCTYKDGHIGLFQGKITTELYPQTENAILKTAGRTFCDAFGGFVICKDGSVTVVDLTHFFPGIELRRGHATILEKRAEEMSTDSIQVGLLVVNKPVNERQPGEYENLLAQAMKYTRGRLIVAFVDVNRPLRDLKPSEIVLTRRIENGTHVYGIELTGTDLKREFTYNELKSMSCEPQFFEFD